MNGRPMTVHDHATASTSKNQEGVMSDAHAALQLTAQRQEPVEKTVGRRLASKEAVEAWGRYRNPHGE